MYSSDWSVNLICTWSYLHVIARDSAQLGFLKRLVIRLVREMSFSCGHSWLSCLSTLCTSTPYTLPMTCVFGCNFDFVNVIIDLVIKLFLIWMVGFALFISWVFYIARFDRTHVWPRILETPLGFHKTGEIIRGGSIVRVILFVDELVSIASVSVELDSLASVSCEFSLKGVLHGKFELELYSRQLKLRVCYSRLDIECEWCGVFLYFCVPSPILNFRNHVICSVVI